jgi:pimeloyl-ACP methyl ester carboxylesterase
MVPVSRTIVDAQERSPGAAVAAQPDLRQIRLKSGLRLHYASRGPADGPAVLMLHGYSDTWFSFSRVLPLMPASMRVIVPDQRGHGASDRPADGYSMDELARDAIELLDALQIDRTMIVGHSMGSFVARRMAVLAPSRVDGLVLIGAGATTRTASVRGMQEAVAALSDPVDPVFVREFQVGTVYRPVPRDFMERVIADSARMPARVWKALLAGMLDYTPGDHEIRCRTLVVGGDHDSVFTRGEQEETARLIPGAKVRIVEGVGHALHWEDPELFARLFLGFLYP